MPILEEDIVEIEREDVLNVGRMKINETFELFRQFVNFLETDVVDGGDASSDFS